MDDGFSEEKMARASEKKFIKKILIFPKNRASEEATIFLLKQLIFLKNGASEEANFFLKERNVTLT